MLLVCVENIHLIAAVKWLLVFLFHFSLPDLQIEGALTRLPRFDISDASE